LPVIIHTAKDLSPADAARVGKLAATVVVKDPRRPERLLDATSLFLHRPEAILPEAKRKMLEELHRSDGALAGKTVLIVDDDARNIFALTSALERQRIKVVHAANGVAALQLLQESKDIELALMDIMMPEMDGYETIREMRKQERFQTMPIIALTAKAMKGDREKCLEAGASDYLPKPVELDHLLSLLRVWLCR
jgi:CheY-like chemotaxis protein